MAHCFSVQFFSTCSVACGAGIDEGGRLTALPQLVDGHVPDLARLPGFVLSLARDVDWAEEKPCFRTLAEARALHPRLMRIFSTAVAAS